MASTNDPHSAPEQHADIVVDGLRRAGAATEYDRRRLGAHGFGVSRKWTEPCGVWLKGYCKPMAQRLIHEASQSRPDSLPR